MECKINFKFSIIFFLKTKLKIELKRGRLDSFRELGKNEISTKKYNVKKINRQKNYISLKFIKILTFFPKTILISMSRIGNLYFLIISFLMLFYPEISPYFEYFKY